jgi:alkylation response protein AidB-like acyl-CoA dehydrogenase
VNEQEPVQAPNPHSVPADVLAAARRLAPLIRAHADETERGRKLAPAVVHALRECGLFAMGLPAVLGGLETPIGTVLQTVEELAYGDGATGWNVMITFDAGLTAGYLHAPESRTLIASIRQPILGASVSPTGRLQRTAGGYRLSGQWRFGSGCQQADAFILGGLLCEGEQPIIGASGMPEMLQIAVRAAEVDILDTWHVAGLRGTGSHDLVVRDSFVAEGFAEPLNFDAPADNGPLYAFPILASFAVAKAAVALGIARHAIEALKDLAQTKTPTGQMNVLRERPAIQTDVARAEALARSSRAFLHEIVEEVWQHLNTGQPVTAQQRALLRLAAVDGVQRAAQAVDLMYNAGGATAIFESSPLERCFRDAHVVTAHFIVQPAVYEIAGRVLLNLPPGTSLF